jgi:uncharacterized protein YkwD
MKRVRSGGRVMKVLGATALLAATATACTQPQPGTASAGSCPPDATGSAMLNYTNGARAAVGVRALSWNGQLGCLAQEWSQHMASIGQLAHRDLGATLSSPAFSGFHTLAENVLDGPTNMSAATMHNLWMGSPLHRANIVSPSFTMFGFGDAVGYGKLWATENFGA